MITERFNLGQNKVKIGRWLGVDGMVEVLWFTSPVHLWFRSSCQTGLGDDCRVEVLWFTNPKYTQILHSPLNKPSCDPYILAFILQKQLFLMNPIPYELVRMTVIFPLSVSDAHEHLEYHFFEHAEQWSHQLTLILLKPIKYAITHLDTVWMRWGLHFIFYCFSVLSP